MIAKISTGSNAFGMVRYNHEKTKGEEKGVLLGVNNIVNTSFETIVSTINDYNNGNVNVSKPCIHISLNFHKNDVLSNEKIHEIAKDYMKEMGYNEQPFAVYRHFDKEHPHVHIVSSQVDSDRKKINDSHLYYRSQALTRELEDKYNVTKAVGKNATIEKDIHSAIYEYLEFGKHSLTAIMRGAIKEVLEKKPTTEKQFEYMLSDYQIKRIISFDDEKKVQGHFFDLRPIELLGLKEEDISQLSKGIYGSDLDINYSYQAIQAQIHINNLAKEALQKNIMGRVYSIVNPINTRFNSSILEQDAAGIKREKLSDLITSFKKKGIQLDIKRTQTGEDPNSIYGLIFKDIKTNHVYTASEIKLKTKDFLKQIDDDLKSFSTEETKNFMNDVDDKFSYVGKPNFNNEYNSGSEEKLNSIFDFAIGFFDSIPINPAPEETPKRKPKRKRR